MREVTIDGTLVRCPRAISDPEARLGDVRNVFSIIGKFSPKVLDPNRTLLATITLVADHRPRGGNQGPGRAVRL